MSRLNMIVQVYVHVVVNRTVVDGDWRFDNLSAVVISRVKVTTSCIISVDVDVSQCQQQSHSELYIHLDDAQPTYTMIPGFKPSQCICSL